MAGGEAGGELPGVGVCARGQEAEALPVGHAGGPHGHSVVPRPHRLDSGHPVLGHQKRVLGRLFCWRCGTPPLGLFHGLRVEYIPSLGISVMHLNGPARLKLTIRRLRSLQA